MPAVPPSVNSSQAAARTMFCVTTTVTAERRVSTARIQKRKVCRSMVGGIILYSVLSTEYYGPPAGCVAVFALVELPVAPQAPGISSVGGVALGRKTFTSVSKSTATD